MFKSTVVKSLYFLLILVMTYGIYAQGQLGDPAFDSTYTQITPTPKHSPLNPTKKDRHPSHLHASSNQFELI